MDQTRNFTNLILKLLKNKGLFVKKRKVLYFFKSHPKYPKLIAITDTFDHFQIDYSLYQIKSISEVNKRNETFLAVLKKHNGEKNVFLVEKNLSSYSINGIRTDVEIIDSHFVGIILLLDRNKKYKYLERLRRLILVVCVTVLLSITFKVLSFNLIDLIFFSFCFFGLLLSYSAITNVLKEENRLSNFFCFSDSKNDCNQVIISKKLIIFKYIDFSILSFSFFLAQLFGLYIFSIFKVVEDFFLIQFLSLSASILAVFISLYYQSFIVKKWCSICIGISLIILLELSFILIFKKVRLSTFDVSSFILLNSIFLSLYLFGTWIIKLLTENNQNIEKEINRNHHLLKYSTFKAILKQNKIVDITYLNSGLIKSNNNINILMVSDPFCEYCKKSFTEVNNLIRSLDFKIAFTIIFNIDIVKENTVDKKIYRTMTQIQTFKDHTTYEKAVMDWYGGYDKEEWLAKYYDCNLEVNKIDEILSKQHTWCKNYNINYTPVLFLNSYKLPNIYDIRDLYFVLEEMNEDGTD